MTRINVQPDSLVQVLEQIQMVLSAIPEERRLKALLICEEMITNQIRHAVFSEGAPEIIVQIKLLKNGLLELLFQDNGDMFDLLKHSDPDMTKELIDTIPGGLGIYLVKEYAEKIRYGYEKGLNIVKIYV